MKSHTEKTGHEVVESRTYPRDRLGPEHNHQNVVAHGICVDCPTECSLHAKHRERASLQRLEIIKKVTVVQFFGSVSIVKSCMKLCSIADLIVERGFVNDELVTLKADRLIYC